jgi:hypothetical protein
LCDELLHSVGKSGAVGLQRCRYHRRLREKKEGEKRMSFKTVETTTLRKKEPVESASDSHRQILVAYIHRL